MKPTMFAPIALLAGCPAEYAIAPIDVHPEAVTECAFEPVEDAPGFERYTCNPVFVATDEAWAERPTATAFGHTELLGHPFYQLWYFSDTDDGPTAGYATSPDGTDWTPHPDNPSWPATSRDAWDGGVIQRPEVAFDPEIGGYVMMYGGISRDLSFFGLGIAVSADGRQWARLPRSPVVDLRLAWGGTYVAWPLAMSVQEHGMAAYLASSDDNEHYGVWRTETADISAWTEPVEEVLPVGRPGRFDDQGFVDASIAELDGVQHMFYVGFGDWVDKTDSVRTSDHAFLGHAVSTDGGRTWDRTSQDPIPVHLTRHGEVSAVDARTVGSRILLWVTDMYPDLGTPGVGYFVYTPGEDR